MDFLLNIDVPVGFWFILILSWIIGMAVLIIRHNRHHRPDYQARLACYPYDDMSSSISPGGIVNSFDGDLDKQLDLTPNVAGEDYLETLRADDFTRLQHRD